MCANFGFGALVESQWRRDVTGNLHNGHDRNARREPPCERRLPWPPARALLPVRDRDVGALLLLRDARAPRALHGEISADRRSRRYRDRAGGPQERAGMDLRAAWHAAVLLAYLRFLHWAGLSHAVLRRAHR